jgi:dimethylhistidine N-methyltransferase
MIDVSGGPEHPSFCAAVNASLSQLPKSLPTRFLYDEVGSELFERITQLPEYYLTRCEAQIFQDHAEDIVAAMPIGSSLVEFGSGSSKKTTLLIDAFLKRQSKLVYAPIDISKEFLYETAERLLASTPGLEVHAISGEYFDVAAQMPSFDAPRLILFLGSNIGNFEPEEASRFLSSLAGQLGPDDRILVGLDLEKDPQIIEAAYNDRAGVTAAFNLNLLHRINQELDANFNLSAFDHTAPYDEAERRVEMRLVSRVGQTVSIDAIGRDFSFDAGEAIHTEWSHKYTVESFAQSAAQEGLAIERVWLDQQIWFASVLLRKADGS